MIIKNGKVYFLKQGKETTSQFIRRRWFIINNINTEYSIEELEKYSKMWLAIQDYQCKYPQYSTEIINELEKNYNI